jgi:hypothetical protein
MSECTRGHTTRPVKACGRTGFLDLEVTLGTENRIPEIEPNYPKTEPNFPNRSVSVPSSVPVSKYPKYPSTELKFPNRTEVPEVPEFAQP